MFLATENVELQVPLVDEFPPKPEEGDNGEDEEETIEVGLEEETYLLTQGKKTLIRR